MDDTVPVRPGEDLNVDRLEPYLRDHLQDIPQRPMIVRQFPSGASNLTYALTCGEWKAVLRRPPLGPIPPRAHDMRRESELLARVEPVFAPAPKPYLFCDDSAVLGAPFYVMERKQGVVLDAAFPAGIQATPTLCRAISQTVIHTLATIHGISCQATGLEHFARPHGFLERQVHGWIDRYDRARTADVPTVNDLSQWFIRHVPTSPEPTLIHNDFKLNNLRFDSGDLAVLTAVLDWEMATIGDPLLDLAIAMSYWVMPDDPPELRSILPTVTTLTGFYRREECIQQYAQITGRDTYAMPFYLAFAYFRLAVILQQIYVRWTRGQTSDVRFARFGEGVRHLIHHTTRVIDTQGAPG